MLKTKFGQLLISQEHQGHFKDLFVIFIACLGLFFFKLGSSGFLDPGDGYFTEAAREMVESGNYIVPHLNYQIYFSKPILIFWLISSAYHVFGINEFAGRFWSALSATVLVIACYELTKLFQVRRAALIAALVLASSPLIITFARMALIDIIFSCFLGVALWAFINSVFFEKPFWWIILYTFLALGVLIKGPVALVLFVLGIAIYVVVKRPSMGQFKKWFSLLHPTEGFILFAAIVLPWCVAVSIATKGLFLKVFLLFENLGRFSGQVNHKHPELWFYLPVLAYGFFPWVICLPAAIKDALRHKLVIKQPDGQEPDDQQLEGRNDAVLFLACWGLAVVGFFSLATAKLQTYILPAWYVFAVLVGIWIDKCITAISTDPQAKIPKSLSCLSQVCLFFALALAAAALIFDIFQPECRTLINDLNPSEIFVVNCAVLVFSSGWIYQWIVYRQRKMNEWVRDLILPLVMTSVLAVPVAFEISYRLKQADLDAVTMRGKGLKLAIFQEFKPSLMFYVHQPIDSFFAPGQLVSSNTLAAGRTSQRPQYVIADDELLPLLKAAHGDKFKTVYKQGNWGLYLAQGLALVRLPTLEQTFTKNLNLNIGDYTWGTLPFAAGKD